MSAGDDLGKLGRILLDRQRAIFRGSVDLAHESIQVGSPITGAPGQPVGQYGPGYHPGKVGGTLRASWQKSFNSTEAVIGTNVEYAQSIEDGVSYAHGGTPLTQRSTVGGFHSVKLTIAGFQRIVDYVAERTPLRFR